MPKKNGRPTKRDDNMFAKVDEYLQECVDKELEFHKTRGEKSDSYERYTKVDLPTLEGFALRLGVATSTLDNWAKEHDGFLGALEKIKEEQKKRLLNSGLDGTYNPTIAKLILSHNHGIRETTINENKNETLNYNIDVTNLTAEQIEEQRKKFLS